MTWCEYASGVVRGSVQSERSVNWFGSRTISPLLCFFPLQVDYKEHHHHHHHHHTLSHPTTMASSTVYEATCSAPVNIAVIKVSTQQHTNGSTECSIAHRPVTTPDALS